MAKTRPPEAKDSARRHGHWIECQFFDSAGYPLAGAPYVLTLPDGSRSEGKLGADGALRRDVTEAGRYEVVFADVRHARWGVERIRVGESVTMEAEAVGFEEGATAVFVVYRRGIRDADAMIDALEGSVASGHVSVQWRLDPARRATLDPNDETVPPGGDFYFEVIAGAAMARSGDLRLVDDLEIRLSDGGAPLVDYMVLLPDGSTRRGRLDALGDAVERDVAPGLSRVFPISTVTR
jgi:hypothetical protein